VLSRAEFVQEDTWSRDAAGSVSIDGKPPTEERPERELLEVFNTDPVATCSAAALRPECSGDELSGPNPSATAAA